MMRTQLLSILAALAVSSTAWGAGHGKSGNTHGAMVSQTAHDARANGQPVGPAVRDMARSNSQGPSHASANGIAHANSHSVLASGRSTGATSGKEAKSKVKKTKTHG